MHNLKKMIWLLFLFCLSGCGVKYNKDINTIVYNLNVGRTFEEKIIFTLPSNILDMDEDDTNNMLMYDDLFPISGDSNYKYQRDVNKGNGKLEIILSYNYLEKEFDYANYATQCFENYDMITHEEYFEAHLSGEFYCWNEQDVEINVSTDYVVNDTNGEKIANDIMWNINKDNYENVDIYYKVNRDYDKQLTDRKDDNMFNTLRYIIGIAIIISLLFVLYRFYKNKKKELDI